jgi:hypothetical protein
MSGPTLTADADVKKPRIAPVRSQPFPLLKTAFDYGCMQEFADMIPLPTAEQLQIFAAERQKQRKKHSVGLLNAFYEGFIRKRICETDPPIENHWVIPIPKTLSTTGEIWDAFVQWFLARNRGWHINVVDDMLHVTKS